MQISRDAFVGRPASAIRTLFGRRGDALLAPLDLCIVEDGEVFNPNTVSGVYVGAPVIWQGAGLLGTILGYCWPPAMPGDRVDPIVAIKPDAAVDIGGVPDVTEFAPVAHENDPVQLDYPQSPITGTIATALQEFPYPTGAYRVSAYLVEFDEAVQPIMHGARVRLTSGALLGILLKTDDFPNGSRRALVHPA